MGTGRVGGIETSNKFSLGLYVADMYEESDHKVPARQSACRCRTSSQNVPILLWILKPVQGPDVSGKMGWN